MNCLKAIVDSENRSREGCPPRAHRYWWLALGWWWWRDRESLARWGPLAGGRAMWGHREKGASDGGQEGMPRVLTDTGNAGGWPGFTGLDYELGFAHVVFKWPSDTWWREASWTLYRKPWLEAGGGHWDHWSGERGMMDNSTFPIMFICLG